MRKSFWTDEDDTWKGRKQWCFRQQSISNIRLRSWTTLSFLAQLTPCFMKPHGKWVQERNLSQQALFWEITNQCLLSHLVLRWFIKGMWLIDTLIMTRGLVRQGACFTERWRKKSGFLASLWELLNQPLHELGFTPRFGIFESRLPPLLISLLSLILLILFGFFLGDWREWSKLIIFLQVLIHKLPYSDMVWGANCWCRSGFSCLVHSLSKRQKPKSSCSTYPKSE